MITGIRGLCNGLGPAMFGLIFYLFHVDLNEKVILINLALNNTPYGIVHSHVTFPHP